MSPGRVRWVPRRVVSGEGGSVGRGARPTPGWLPGGLGLVAVAREVTGKSSMVLSGGAALPWERVLRTVTSCYLGICKKGFVGLNSVLSAISGQVAGDIPAWGVAEGLPSPKSLLHLSS